MGHKKLIRFEEIKSFPNVLIFPDTMAGNWSAHFGHNKPLTLELACGKGEYTLELARMFPEKSFVGVDIKGNRIWKGARTALDEGLKNVAFLRIHIDHIREYFSSNEVSEIWITFPDPYLRKSKAKKRLTHPRFLHAYHHIMRSGGKIHLKTDSAELYDFTKEVIEQNHCVLHRDIPNVYAGGNADPLLQIKTFYEQMHLNEGRIIRYLEFSLPEVLPPLPKKKEQQYEQA